MRKYIGSLIILSFGATLQANILPNSSFELWIDTLGVQMPIGWFTSEYSYSGSAIKDTTSHTGDYAVKLEHDSIAFITTTTLISSDKDYLFSGWAKGPGGSFVLAWQKELGETIGDTIFIPVIGAINYKEYTKTITPPESATSIIVGFLAVPKVKAYLDDITLASLAVEETESSEFRVQSSEFKVYPNPSTTGIRSQWTGISENQKVSLRIYDLSGRLVKSFPLITNHLPLTTAVEWDGRDERNQRVASGIYFCELYAEHKRYTQQIIFLNK